ncbi:MAG: hypothetical protein CSA33_03835 [Desulfobulbus propionicus]|nr:MAG: hypothetical protein CSA33_03835 [Desulfobulbus propionicus]
MKTRVILLSAFGIVGYVMIAGYHGKLTQKQPFPNSYTETRVVEQATNKHLAVIGNLSPQNAPEERAANKQQAQEDAVTPQKHAQQKAEQTTPTKEQKENKQVGGEVLQTNERSADQDLLVKQYQKLLRQSKQANMVIRDLTRRNQKLLRELEQAKTANNTAQERSQEKLAGEQELAKAHAVIEQLKAALNKQGERQHSSDQLTRQNQEMLTQLREQLKFQKAEVGRLQARLADTSSQLAITRKLLKKADLKAGAMIRLSQDKANALKFMEQEGRALQLAESGYGELPAAMDQFKQQIAEFKAVLADQVKETRQQLEASTEKRMIQEKELQQVREALAAAQSDKDRLAGANKALEKETSVLKEAQAAAKKERESLFQDFQASQDHVKTLETQLSELESTLALTKTALAESEGQRNQVTQSINPLKAQITEKDGLFAALQQEMLSLANQLEEAQGSTQTLSEENAALKAQINTLQQGVVEMDTLKSTILEKDQDISALSTQLEDLETRQYNFQALLDQKETALAEAHAKEETLTPLVAQVEELKAVIEQKEHQINEATTKLEELTFLKDQEKQLQTTLTEKEDALAASQAQIENLQQTIAALSQNVTEQEAALTKAHENIAQLTPLKEQLELASHQVIELTANLEDKESRISALAGELEAVSQEKTGLATQVDTLQQTAKEVDKLRRSLQKNVDALTIAQVKLNEIQSEKSVIEALNSQIEQLSLELESAKAARLEADNNAGQSKEEIARITASLAASEEKVASLEAAWQDAKDTIVQLSEEVKNKPEIPPETLQQQGENEKRIISLKDQVTQLQTQLTDMQTQHENTSQQIETLNQQLNAKSMELDKAAAHIATIEQRKEALEQNIADLEQDKGNLKQILTNMEQNQTDLQDKLAQSNAALEESRARVDALQDGLQSLQAKNEQMLLQTTDSDGDGVNDATDACPDTASGIPVDKTGCEVDTDKDGIVDRLDLCPDTAAGGSVNGLGCEAEARIVLEGVTFKTGTAVLTDEARQGLDKVVTTLVNSPEIQCAVAGYTDSTGDVNRNMQVSERRAQAVVEYFISKDLAAERFTVAGYGPADPIADNATAQGRAKNRRVELHPVSQQ